MAETSPQGLILLDVMQRIAFVQSGGTRSMHYNELKLYWSAVTDPGETTDERAVTNCTAKNSMYIGITNIAPSLGPVIGGSITERLGRRWVFWFLVVLTGTHFWQSCFFARNPGSIRIISR